ARDLNTGSILWKRDRRAAVNDITLSRDGRYVAAIAEMNFGVIDALTGKDVIVGDVPNLTFSMRNHPFLAFRILFYPESDQLLLVGGCTDPDNDKYESVVMVIRLEEESP